MRNICISALLFLTVLAFTVPGGSQTRPRRVRPADNDSSATNASDSQELAVNDPVAANANARVQERPRTSGERRGATREGEYRHSRWPGWLGSTISIGVRGMEEGGSCGPSRGVLIGRPR